MVYKPVGADETGHFPPRVTTMLDATYVAKEDDAYRVKKSQLSTTLDNRDALQAIVTSVVASGIRKIVLPEVEIPLGAQITIPSNAHGLIIEGRGSGTVIKQITGAVNKALIYGAGTDGSKTALAANATAGDTTLTIPTAVASTLSIGSLLGLECETIVYGQGITGQEAYASEIRKVTAVSGTSVTVDGPLLHTYLTSANAVAWKMTPLVGVELRNFTMTSADAPNIKARNIMFEKMQGLRIRNVTIKDSGGGIYLNDTLDSSVSDVTIDGLPNVSNFLGYGVGVMGRSAHVYVENLHGRNMRHLFTTLADERTVGAVTTQWGGPRHVTIRGGVAEQVRSGTQYSLWDTHPYGYDIVFDQCRAYGGSGAASNGFQIRSKHSKLINPVALYSGNNGIRVDSTVAEDTEIVGGEVAYAASGGIALGKRTTVRGVYIHHNAAGIIVVDNAIGSRIADNKIEENTYGIHDQSAGGHTGIVVQGNHIPKSVTQTNSALSPKSDMIIAFNILPGYGAGLDGVGGTIGAGVIRARNYVDSNAETFGQLTLDPGNASQVLSLVQKFGGVEAFRIRRASASDDAVVVIPTGRKIQVIGGTTEFLTTAVKLSATTDIQVATTTTAPAAGAAGALPATPQGYAQVMINGTLRTVAYYP